MVAGRFIRSNDKGYAKKLETYECGEEPTGQAWFNFNPRFYIIALIYIVFDIEVAFIYPIATVFKRWVAQGNGWFAFAELAAFIALLILGLVYVWAKGDLDWIRTLKHAARTGVQNVRSSTPKESLDAHASQES
jgi:NADH-quinone oxidoreductase subunit A